MQDPHDIPIYHITHIRNLRGIIQAGGLWCDHARLERGIENISIAHQSIKDRRARKQVPVAAGGVVADYVPFYFATRSPMLYSIHKGNVACYHDGQENIVYLVSKIGEICNCGNAWCFTDGHAEMSLSNFYDDLRHIDQVNWRVMAGTFWHDTKEAPDRSRQRQAEFLVHHSFPWRKFLYLGVQNPTMAAKVLEEISTAEYQPRIVVKSGWYF